MHEPNTQPGSCSCCGTTRRRRTINEYFDDGRRRIHSPPLSIQGTTRKSKDGLIASFSLDLEGDRIAAVSFRSTTCITLVAYCECLAEMVEGLALRDATRACPNLVAQLPGVHAMKQHRAALAISAFLAAVHVAVQPLQSS